MIRLNLQTGSGAAAAHLVWDQGVGGSNPPSPTINLRSHLRASSTILHYSPNVKTESASAKFAIILI